MRPRTYARFRPIWLIFTIVVLATIHPSISTAASIKNIPPTAHLAPAGTPLVDLAASIRLAVEEQGWNIISEGPGTLIASLHIRTHFAVVAIHYDASNYSIEYVNSSNLDYSPRGRKKTKTRRAVPGPRIHKNYNIWVEKLSINIAIHAAAPTKAKVDKESPASNTFLIADELEKLDALRERGILSQREFDQQKAKLLAQ